MMASEDYIKKYASIYQLINLPGKRKLQIPVQTIFYQPPNTSQYVTQAIKRNRNQLVENVHKELEIFDNTQYHFKFPQSKFRPIPPGESNKITYEQRVQVEEQDTFKEKLTEEQIGQMRQKGQFQVQSSLKNVKIPYVWKVNDRLLRGRTNIVNIWENGLAFCYSLIDQGIQNVKVIIPQKLKKLASLPKQFFTIVFGRKSLTSIYTPDYTREVYKDFWNDIFKNQLKDLKNQIGHDLLEKLYLKYQAAIYEHIKWDPILLQKGYQQKNRIREQKITLYNGKKGRIDSFKEQLKDTERKFVNNWNKIKRRILTKISNQLTTPQLKSNQNQKDHLQEQKVKQKDNEIIEKLHQQKYLLYIAHLRQHLPKKNISLTVIQALVQLITIFSMIQNKLRIKSQKLKEIQTKTHKQISNKYRIRSKNYHFQNRLFNEIYNPISKQIEKQFYENLLDDPKISALLTEQYKSIYKKYVELQKNIDNLITKKKSTLQSIKVPQRVFRTTYRLLPPYQKFNHNGYYQLKKQQEMTIDTSANFWKIKLYGMRIKSWTINCAVSLLGLAWVGPFGLRCLDGQKDFIYDQNCKYDTGQIIFVKRSTVLGVFNKVRQGVKRSRDYFQSLPDRGLFGKKFSRYFNYFQCYVFRLFFVGIILVLILYPIAIIVLSILCILLVFSVWLWVPLMMVICYLFNILVFQFQCSNRSGVNITGVPLISLAWRIISSIIFSLYCIVYLILIAPIISGIYSLFLVIQRGFRTFTDQIMLFLIKKLGRTPSRDTAIAKKISGPTMARKHFYSINEQDVYVLVQSKLEQIHVGKFVQLTKSQISCHLRKYSQILKFVLQPFGYYNACVGYQKDLMNRNVNQLSSHFNKLALYYTARYPNNPYNIRFTAQEIDLYFQNSVKIVRNFVEKQRIKEWIFDQYSVLYEDYEQLTRALWISIFNCGEQIFQPLQKLQVRFKINQQNPNSNNKLMRQHVDSVMKALEGEVSLSHRDISFNPFKGSLLDKDRPFNFIENICNVHYYNSQLRLDINLTDPSYIMVPPRNLQELGEWNQYQRKNSKENNKVIFEQMDIMDID